MLESVHVHEESHGEHNDKALNHDGSSTESTHLLEESVLEEEEQHEQHSMKKVSLKEST